MEQLETQNLAQSVAESSDKQELNLSTTPELRQPKKNISSGEDAFIWQPLFKELEYDCLV